MEVDSYPPMKDPLIGASDQCLPLHVGAGIRGVCGRIHSGDGLSSCENCRFLTSQQRGVPTTSSGSVRPWSAMKSPQIYAPCVSCMAAVEVPGNHHPSVYTICSACKACDPSTVLEQRTNTRPSDSLLSNVYPPQSSSLIPISGQTLDAPFSFTTYFNAHGQLAIPSHNVLHVCIRLGCGTRLPQYHVGKICEACIKAGLGCGYNRTMSAGLKRVPRRMEPLSHRLWKCIDGPKSDCQLPAQTSVSTEKEDVHMNLDLAYPDDVTEGVENLSSEPHAPSQTPPAKEYDVEAELDLVYPDDAMNVISHFPPNQPKPMTRKERPSLSLSESFQHSLISIPLLSFRSDKTASSAPNSVAPMRLCETLGCEEVLPCASSRQRCVKCTFKYWKRKQAVIGDRGKASLPRPSGETWSTKGLASTGQSAVTSEQSETDAIRSMSPPASDCDHTSEGEDVRGSGVPPPSLSPSPPEHGNSGWVTDDVISSVPGWDSDLTDLLSTDDDGEEETDVECTSTSLKIRIPLLIYRQPPDTSLRKCAYKRCNIALSEDSRWKTCEACRGFQRAYQRARHENVRRRLTGNSNGDAGGPSVHRGRSRRSPTPTPSELETDETELTPENSRPCKTKHCQRLIPLPEVYKWKTCKKCRARARHEARRKSKALQLIKSPSELHQPDATYPSYPAYQYDDILVSSFKTRLEHFVEAQILYLRAKLHSTGECSLSKVSPTMFTFEGEYSTIVGQRGSSGSTLDTAANRREVHSIVQGLQDTLRTDFQPSEAFSINTGGIIMRFSCTLELIAPLRPLPSNKQGIPLEGDASQADCNGLPSHIPLVKPMSGDLEVAIVPDNTHKFFVGQRTIIRFRMSG